ADSKLLATNEDKLLVTSDGPTQEFNARIWNVATGEEFRPLLQHPGGVAAGAFTADGARLVTASADGVRLWDLLTGREMLLQHDAATLIAVSRDGKYLATAD